MYILCTRFTSTMSCMLWLKKKQCIADSVSDGIVSHMRKQAGPSAREFSSIADLEKFLDSTEHSVIGKAGNSPSAYFYDDPLPHHTHYTGFFTEEASKLRKAFTSAADSMRESFRFAFSTAKEVHEKYSYSE